MLIKKTSNVGAIVAKVIDSLLSTSGTDALSANQGNILASLIGLGGVLDVDPTASNGYIRIKTSATGGIQIAWKQATVTAGGTMWDTTTDVWYSDHALGNWAAPFSTIFAAVPNSGSTSYWATLSGWGNTTAGTMRCFRPNASTGNTAISVIAIGAYTI